ncbi:TPA: tRNA-binding protein [archaeon]|nr:tRNA-binding protein [Candidatus Naiadarchaeales archaeon SRR2090153.bin461]
MEITWQDFEKVDMRVGTILAAEPNAGAKKQAYKLKIDFGPVGIKYSSAQITGLYSAKDLIGKQILAVVNFLPKQVASVKSECLVLGVLDKQGIVLLQPERKVENGGRVA